MRPSKRLRIGLTVTVLALAVAAAGVAFTPLNPLVLSAPLRFDYVPAGGAGTKPLLTSDLDGPFIRAVSQSGQTVTFTYQASDNQAGSLQMELPDEGATLTGATYSANTETLTLTLSEGGPVTADLSAVTTSAELANVVRELADAIAAAIARAKTEMLADAATAADTAIAAALAAETDAVLTGATYTADNQTLTLTLSEGGPVTADLSGIDATGAELTGATYSASTETLTLTLSEGGPVTADLSGLTTASEVATAITTAINASTASILADAATAADTAIAAALAAETDAVLTGATYAGDTETLTLTLSEGRPVTADLSRVTTAAELSAAITLAITAADTAIAAALAAETDAVLTGATYAGDTETLTLTLSEGGPVTADLSGLTTATEVTTAVSAAIAGDVPQLLGTNSRKRRRLPPVPTHRHNHPRRRLGARRIHGRQQ